MHQGRLHFVVFREEECWVAQCIEYDIGTQACSLEQVQLRIAAALQAEVAESLTRYGTLLGGLGAAPRQFSAIWARRSSSYVWLDFSGAQHLRADVALCKYQPLAGHPAKKFTLSEYCAWVTSAGCSVTNNIFVGRTGYAERLTKLRTSALKHALEVGILDADVLVPATLARLNRRLGIQHWLNDSAQSGVLRSGI